MNDIPLASDSVAFPVLSASSFAGGQGLGLNDECPVQMVGTDVCLAVGQNGTLSPTWELTEFASSCSRSDMRYQCIGVVPHRMRDGAKVCQIQIFNLQYVTRITFGYCRTSQGSSKYKY